MHWQKLGLLYCPPDDSSNPELVTHASNPLAVHLHDDVFRVFYSGRDTCNRSSVGAVDIDIISRSIKAEHDETMFSCNSENTFYRDGVSIGCIYKVDGNHYMLFMGWQHPIDKHWRGDIGRIRLSGSLELSLDPSIPYMESDIEDPISLSYPWVFRHANGEFIMVYGSTLTWDGGNGEMIHVLKHASSSDGKQWTKHGIAITHVIGQAQAFSRPTVLAASNGYHMWFSFRSGSGTPYRIGYAHSTDGYAWDIDNGKSGIDVSTHGWDAEMIEYPFVFQHKGEAYMLYNGNGFGRTGFGLARLTEHSFTFAETNNV